YQDSTVVPTRTANLWFARNAIFAEAGPKLLGDDAQWVKMIRRLRPGNLKAVVGGRTQAPRSVLLCFNSEIFTQPGASDKLASIARNLQTRLGEISQTLGISLPVYVLFTRADRLPYFAESVRTLSNEEAGQVLGVTLPIQTGSGVYAEQQSNKLNHAFNSLFHSLCDRRLEFLPREGDEQKIPNAYEFPREFRKLRPLLVQFLVDLCRPSQLRTSPFLRGFYFSGVRPVVVNEVAAPAPRRAAEQERYEPAGSATGVFNAPHYQQTAQQSYAPQVTGTRKVPQWLFLSRLFHEVLLRDQTAMVASGSSTRTSALQRVLLASAAALGLILAVGFTVSYFGNRKLVNNASAAAQAIAASEASGENLASLDALQRLETLRQSLEQLTIYEREGRPFGLGWGLYAGSDAYPHVRSAYYNRFNQLLLGQTKGTLQQHLAALPSSPGESGNYNYTYEDLKAYLITTSHHDKSTQQFLSPVLLDRWSAGHEVDAARMELARKQFDFYSEDLKTANPFTNENDSEAVERGRHYLSQFSGIESIYNFMLSEAAKKNPPVNFNKKFAGSSAAVINNRDVAGPFTLGGWATMQDFIKNADDFFAGERWVLGEEAAAPVDRAKLTQDLKNRYVADFINQWRNYLKVSSVVRYGSLKDAAKKLDLQSGNASPILALFWLASQNTAVDDPRVKEVFQPVHAVVPPENKDRYVAPSNQPYMNALLTLQTSIDQAANMPGVPDPATVSSTLSNASNAKISVKQIAQSFRVDREANVGGVVQKLLEDPITYAEGLLRALGPAELNSKGKGLCQQFSAVLSKFPFNPAAKSEATLAEVNGLLKPGDGALWAFYESNLKKALAKQGNLYVQTGEVPLNPAFVSFFNNAARFSDVLYKGGAGPKLSYTITPLESEGIRKLTLAIDGQVLNADGDGGSGKQFMWPGAGAQSAKLSGNLGGPDLNFFNYDGLWAAFRLFADAERWEPSGAGYNLAWVVRLGGRPTTLPDGSPLTVRVFLDLGGAPPFFKKGGLAGLDCVSRVAR
ncbi:MAG: ImcF-related family protein, partial [Bryobacteraceae bacterium]